MELFYIIGIIILLVVVSILVIAVYITSRWLKGAPVKGKVQEAGSKKTKSYF